MTSADPLENGGLASVGRRFREGRVTAEAATLAYLERIDALDDAQIDVVLAQIRDFTGVFS